MSKASPYNGRSRSMGRSDSQNRTWHRDKESGRERDLNREREQDRKQSRSDMQARTAEDQSARNQFDTDEHPFELRHEVKRLNGRLDKITDTLQKADFKYIIENYMDTKKRLITNFTAGLARGLGMTVGTVVVLSLLGYILSLFVKMPVIGEYIAELQRYVDQAR